MVESGGLCDWQTINWLELHIWVINEYLVGTRWPPQMVPGSDIDALPQTPSRYAHWQSPWQKLAQFVQK